MFPPPSLSRDWLPSGDSVVGNAIGQPWGAIQLFEFWRNRCHPCDCRPCPRPCPLSVRPSSKEGGSFSLLAICRISGRVHTLIRCSAHGEPLLVDLRHSRAPGCGAGSLLDNALAFVRIFVRGVDMFSMYINSSITTHFPIIHVDGEVVFGCPLSYQPQKISPKL